MKTTFLLLSVVVSQLLNGCVGVLPVPPDSNTPAVGTPVTSDQVKFIVPGRTTRDEVVAKLGERFRESCHTPVLAYSWERPAWGYCWWVWFFTPDGVVTGGNYEEGNVWRAYYVKFDAGGHVVKTKFARLDNDKSLDEQMEDWAFNQPKSLLAVDAGHDNPTNNVSLPFDWMKDSLQIQPAR
jgi:hypothetical protein